MVTYLSKIRFFLGFLVLVAGVACAVPARKPVTAEVIAQENVLDASTIAYLQTKQVDATLRAALDELFFSEPIHQLLSDLYTAHTWSKLEKAKKALKKQGFKFIGGKYHVFSHPSFPEYVFKIALPFDERWEWLNAGRIKFAAYLQEVIDRYSLRIKVPKKQAYFMHDGSDTTLPYMIVVAEKMDLTHAKPLSKKSPLMADVEVIKDMTGFADGHEDNIMKCGDHVVIVDTEERRYMTWREKMHAKVGKVIHHAVNAIVQPGKQMGKILDKFFKALHAHEAAA